MQNIIQIAVDGPAGAGKSSVAKILAEKMKFIYIDTGAMYRAITYKAIKLNIDLEDKLKLEKMAADTVITFNYDGEQTQKLICDGQDITKEIRAPIVSQKVSIVAAIPEIRNIMVELQRQLAKDNNVIMDGRDIGTVVFPQAKYKFFLTASLEERAKRRLNELRDRGYDVNYSDVLAEISQRDQIDTERAFAPLKPAKDAIIIDTSDLHLEQVVDKMLLTIVGEKNNAL